MSFLHYFRLSLSFHCLIFISIAFLAFSMPHIFRHASLFSPCFRQISIIDYCRWWFTPCWLFRRWLFSLFRFHFRCFFHWCHAFMIADISMPSIDAMPPPFSSDVTPFSWCFFFFLLMPIIFASDADYAFAISPFWGYAVDDASSTFLLLRHHFISFSCRRHFIDASPCRHIRWLSADAATPFSMLSSPYLRCCCAAMMLSRHAFIHSAIDYFSSLMMTLDCHLHCWLDTPRHYHAAALTFHYAMLSFQTLRYVIDAISADYLPSRCRRLILDARAAFWCHAAAVISSRLFLASSFSHAFAAFAFAISIWLRYFHVVSLLLMPLFDYVVAIIFAFISLLIMPLFSFINIISLFSPHYHHFFHIDTLMPLSEYFLIIFHWFFVYYQVVSSLLYFLLIINIIDYFRQDIFAIIYVISDDISPSPFHYVSMLPLRYATPYIITIFSFIIASSLSTLITLSFFADIIYALRFRHIFSRLLLLYIIATYFRRLRLFSSRYFFFFFARCALITLTPLYYYLPLMSLFSPLLPPYIIIAISLTLIIFAHYWAIIFIILI